MKNVRAIVLTQIHKKVIILAESKIQWYFGFLSKMQPDEKLIPLKIHYSRERCILDFYPKYNRMKN